MPGKIKIFKVDFPLELDKKKNSSLKEFCLHPFPFQLLVLVWTGLLSWDRRRDVLVTCILSTFSLTSKGLVTNYGMGGGRKIGGKTREVLPLQKDGGAEKFSHLEGGGHIKFLCSFYAVA